MKKRDWEELKTKPAAELQKSLKEARERLRVLKFDLAAGKVKDVRELHDVKKGIARLLTLLNQNK